MGPVRQRVHNLRRRAIAASVALFVALFSGIGIQLASGHDPALKASSAKTTSTGTTASTGTTPATSKRASPTTLAPVTTSQS
jgi:hypothetical protein